MNEIKITYVDAAPDMYISHYLAQVNIALGEDVNAIVQEIAFDGADNMMQLIQNEDVQRANIVLLDSDLFKNNKEEKRVVGEQVVLLLKKINPFIKVIVISQRGDLQHVGVVAKFKSEQQEAYEEATAYYGEHLLPRLETAVRSIMKYRTIRRDVDESDETKVLLDQIDGLMHGNVSYSNVRQADIDKLILQVKNLEESYE